MQKASYEVHISAVTSYVCSSTPIAVGPVARDPFAHLVVERLGGRDEHRVAARRLGARLPIAALARARAADHEQRCAARSEEHTSELQSLMRISYAVFCVKKKKQDTW